jgi:hypothetical protein
MLPDDLQHQEEKGRRTSEGKQPVNRAQNLWLAICIGFTVLFFVGLFRFGSELSLKSWRNAGSEWVS